jgi:tRNA-2-methylthio-N6-dimethylallyladenosine synthase
VAKRFFIETFGCQMNVNDSERVAGLLAARGYEAAGSPESADVIFINTCAVREKASEKLYSSLGRMSRLKDGRPDLRVSVGGCVAQLHGTEILDRAPGVDVLVGTHTLSRLPDLLDAPAGGAKVDLDRKADSFVVPPALIAHSNPYRAYVTVMEGCNHVCSFCVVPRTRGVEVCRPPDDIVGEVSLLAGRGVPEVMLLGQTVNAYRFGDSSFVDLLARVDGVPGLARLRFTTSHPSHMTPSVARSLASLKRLCPYVHLPVQSGSNRILASMRRGYTHEQYRDIAACLRSEIPGLALTSDVIVGYPGETEEDFEATLRLVEETRFDGLFVFHYSPRPGTSALRLTDDVSTSEKKKRFRLLNDLQQRHQRERNATLVGRRVPVLAEAVDRQPDRLTGRTPQFQVVHFDGPTAALGTVVDVVVTATGANSLIGQIASPSDSLTGDSAARIF